MAAGSKMCRSPTPISIMMRGPAGFGTIHSWHAEQDQRRRATNPPLPGPAPSPLTHTGHSLSYRSRLALSTPLDLARAFGVASNLRSSWRPSRTSAAHMPFFARPRSGSFRAPFPQQDESISRAYSGAWIAIVTGKNAILRPPWEANILIFHNSQFT